VKEDVSRKVKKRGFSQRRKDRKENLSKKEQKVDSGAPPLSILLCFSWRSPRLWYTGLSLADLVNCKSFTQTFLIF
jgi:hypothetical protein